MTSYKCRILVVEDEGIIARDITAMLEQLDYEVTGQAGTGAEALELASIVASDLVLMDIQIRGPIDGVQTAEQIRKRFGVPVVFLTAHADGETLKRANRTEPFGYVVKPFTESSLKAAIEVGLNRSRLQKESDAKQTWFRTALESISDAVVAVDNEGQILFLNAGAERLTGWTTSEAGVSSFENVVRLQTQDGQAVAGYLEQVMAGEDAAQGRPLQVLHRNGSQRTVIGSAGAIHQPGTQVIEGFVAILRDVSDLDLPGDPLGFREGCLRTANKNLQDLSYALSNELREPVRNMACFAQLLERQGKERLDEAGREYLDFIVEGSRRIEGQLSALRRYHLAGERNAERSLTDAAAVCNQVLNKLGGAIREVGAAVKVSSLPSVAVSAPDLQEIFENLLSNALRFHSERTPVVAISAFHNGSSWQFTVQDNGVGFEGTQAERIFQLFTKAHETVRSGAGAGLAITRRLVEQAGGKIWAESMPGHGSVFHFTLPGQRPSVIAA